MWKIIGIIVLVSILLILVRLWLLQPVKKRNIKTSDFNKYLKELFTFFEVGSFFFAKHNNSDKFIQCALTDLGKENVTFEFGIPLVEWSENFFECIKTEAHNIGFDITTEEPEKTKKNGFQKFLRMKSKQKINEAVETAASWCLKLQEIMEINKEDYFTIHIKGNVKSINKIK